MTFARFLNPSLQTTIFARPEIANEFSNICQSDRLMSQPELIDVDEPTELIPNKLYLGSIVAARDLEKINLFQIKGILNCSPSIRNYFESKCVYYNIDIEDQVQCDISSFFEATHEFVAKQGCVLIHCLGGASRSVTFCISYLMKYQNMNLKESYDFIRDKRFIIHPNIGFMKQLLEYELKLFGKNSLDWGKYIAQHYCHDVEIPKEDLLNIVKELLEREDSPVKINDYILDLWKQKQGIIKQ